MNEILSTEKDFVEKLTEQERQIFLATAEQLSKLRTLNDYCTNYYVDIALLLESLHRMHERYNYMYEAYCCETTDAKVEELLEESFNCTMSIGLHSAVLELSNMDNCDAMYRLLSQIKMNQFDIMLDSISIDKLVACF